MQCSETVCNILQLQGEDASGQKMTLSTVRKMQSKLHSLEQTLLQTHSSPYSAAGAASHSDEIQHSSTHSGSHGDLYYDVDDLHSPGAEGASGGNMEVFVKKYRPCVNIERSQRDGVGRDLDVDSSHRHSETLPKEQCNSGRANTLSQRSGSGRSRRQPLSHKTLQRDTHSRHLERHRRPTSPHRRDALLDFNSNAATDPSPVSASSEKEPLVPSVVQLSLKETVPGKEHCQSARPREAEGESGAGKLQNTAPHLSMSKRQLLDEIRREKDEHRKNVR